MAVQPDSCEQLLAKMVGFDTVNAAISGRPGAEAALAGFLDSYAGRLGFETDHLPVDDASYNLLITHKVSIDAPWLLFVSHMDTVSTENMTIDPLVARMEEGRIYGRGACDTKGSGAAMLWALKQYRDAGETANNVAVLLTVDEEISKTGAKAFADRHLNNLVWRPVGAIVGEPTLLRPVVAHNGVVRWRIRTTGVAAHSSDPAQGRSAISMMVEVIRAIESQYIPALTASHDLTGPARCSINVIRGGSQVNIIPDSCEITLDRRIVPGENADDVLPAVEVVLERLRRDNRHLNVMQERPFTDPPLDPVGNEPFITFVQSVLAGLSLPTGAMGAAYGTEASNLSEVGIPAVVLGPGSIEQAHTKAEWLALDQLHCAVDVYLRLMSHPVGSSA